MRPSTKVLTMTRDKTGVWTWEKGEVHKYNGYWWFRDVSGKRIGPYLTKESAYSGLTNYTNEKERLRQ